jgi:hypothetical protein
MLERRSAYEKWHTRQPRWLQNIMVCSNMTVMAALVLFLLLWMADYDNSVPPKLTCVITSNGHRVCGELEP